MLSPSPPDATRFPPITSPRAYINERMRQIREQIGSNTTSASMYTPPRPNSPQQLSWSHTAASSKERREEVSKIECIRKESNASHFVEYHKEQHQKLVESARETKDKIERAERNKAFKKVAQQMARDWSRILMTRIALLGFRRTLFIGYREKWKKILVYLLFQRWWRKTQRCRARCDQLRFNLILRKCIPQIVERIRSRRRGGQIPLVRGFLQNCLVANKFPRVLHAFLMSVRRAQRVIRRRRLVRLLRATAIKLALDRAALQSREERYSGSVLPDAVKFIVAKRLCRIDMEATMFEKRNMLDRFLADVDGADRAETLRNDFFIHCQSIVLQSAMIAAFRLPALIKHTGLLQLVKEYDYGKQLSLEQRDRLRRWYIGLYLRMYQRKPYRIDMALTPKGAPPNLLEDPKVFSVRHLLHLEGEAAAVAEVSEYHLQQWKRWHLLAAKATGAVPMGLLATSKAGGTLGAMAKACPAQLLPFFHEHDLVMSVLGPLVKPIAPRPKKLLSAQNLSLLLRMTRESWQAACRSRRNKLDASGFDGTSSVNRATQPGSSPLTPAKKKIDGVPLSMEEKLEMDKTLIDTLTSQYSDLGSGASQEEIEEVARTMDFSFLDSYYRRAR